MHNTARQADCKLACARDVLEVCGFTAWVPHARECSIHELHQLPPAPPAAAAVLLTGCASVCSNGVVADVLVGV